MEKISKQLQVSIVITVKNEAKSIDSLIKSLENQKLTPKEIIFVDGGSTDKTIDIIKEEMKKNKKIRLFIEKGASISRGRNLGVLNSISEIIAMTDVGCIASPNWLMNIVNPIMSKDKIGIVAGSYKMTGDSLFQESLKPFLGIPYQLASSSNFLPSGRSIAFNKAVWKKVGGFCEELDMAGEDTLFNYLAKKKKIKFYFSKKAFVSWEVPKNLIEAFKKFFRYSKGDAQTGIWWHPEKKFKTHNIKIMFIYLRYLIALLFIFLSLKQIIFLKILIISAFTYIIWSIVKNYSKVERKLALIFSPLIQICSDIAIMLGFAFGMISKL